MAFGGGRPEPAPPRFRPSRRGCTIRLPFLMEGPMARDDSLAGVGIRPVTAEARVGAFLRGVYGWMAAGLAITALVAFFVASSNWIGLLATHRWLLFALFIAQIGVVITLSAGASRIAPGAATALFLGYSALTGVTLSLILLVYTRESIEIGRAS